MIAVDTNILVRLVTRDDEDQYQRSLKLFHSEDLFIGHTVIQETEWVLRNGYGFSVHSICDAFAGLFGLANVTVEDPFATERAMNWSKSGMDFSDALHLSRSYLCASFATFDKNMIKKGRQVSSIPIQQP